MIKEKHSKKISLYSSKEKCEEEVNRRRSLDYSLKLSVCEYEVDVDITEIPEDWVLGDVYVVVLGNPDHEVIDKKHHKNVYRHPTEIIKKDDDGYYPPYFTTYYFPTNVDVNMTNHLQVLRGRLDL